MPTPSQENLESTQNEGYSKEFLRQRWLTFFAMWFGYVAGHVCEVYGTHHLGTRRGVR